jgi:hypothetical protein
VGQSVGGLSPGPSSKDQMSLRLSSRKPLHAGDWLTNLDQETQMVVNGMKSDRDMEFL